MCGSVVHNLSLSVSLPCLANKRVHYTATATMPSVTRGEYFPLVRRNYNLFAVKKSEVRFLLFTFACMFLLTENIV